MFFLILPNLFITCSAYFISSEFNLDFYLTIFPEFNILLLIVLTNIYFTSSEVKGM